ncbi:acyltransferase family protein [Paenibacillus sp. JCM 10914]|uniref:acyltransferase family protein n=1 Tax=Paenibacillus sp. JCM 10914 TaxID=1236974 RepID=UPI0003CCA8FF|nr:acyltransferase family protein [Paenibacillus sp. JCM 10914]GAE07370.1 membrane protein [Paenibacillus sp. JCM 10914]
MRDAYFDNLKFVLIVLVVGGHFIEPLVELTPIAVLYNFIYSFHMPLFVFVTGYFSKRIEDDRYTLKILQGLVIPYLIFQSLYALFDYYVLSGEKLAFTYFYPNWILWFLFSCVLWKVFLPYVVKIRYPILVCLIVAILAGYSADISYFAGLSRTLYFFPFFLMGYYFKREWVNNLMHSSSRVAAMLLLPLSVVVLWKLADVLPITWFYGVLPYVDFELTGIYAGLSRLATYGFTLIVSVCVLALIPSVRIPLISDFGQNTLYVFILHGFILKALYSFEFQYTFASVWDLWWLLPIVFIVTILLSSNGIRHLFQWLVEPDTKWLFHKGK